MTLSDILILLFVLFVAAIVGFAGFVAWVHSDGLWDDGRRDDPIRAKYYVRGLLFDTSEDTAILQQSGYFMSLSSAKEAANYYLNTDCDTVIIYGSDQKTIIDFLTL